MATHNGRAHRWNPWFPPRQRGASTRLAPPLNSIVASMSSDDESLGEIDNEELLRQYADEDSGSDDSSDMEPDDLFETISLKTSEKGVVPTSAAMLRDVRTLLREGWPAMRA